MGAYDRRATSTITVQMDGKVRGVVRMPAGAPVEAVRGRVANDKAFERFLAGRRIVREVYVPGRVYSLVTVWA